MNPHHDFGLYKQEVSHLPLETTFLYFFLLTREKCTVNNVGWKIPYSRDSHLERTEYTGNKYTPVISERGNRLI